MDHSHNASPFNFVPPVIVALCLVMAGVEIAMELGVAGMIGGPGAVGWRLDYVQRFAVSAPLFQWMVQNHHYEPEYLMRFVAYAFLHANFTHMLFAAVITLAMGRVVGEVFHTVALLVIWAGSAIGGALAYVVVTSGNAALIGGLPAAYGMIGAFTYLLFDRMRRSGENPLQAFRMILFLIGIQLVFMLAFGSGQQWVAELAGFATGFLMSFVVSPAGWARIVAVLRGR